MCIQLKTWKNMLKYEAGRRALLGLLEVTGTKKGQISHEAWKWMRTRYCPRNSSPLNHQNQNLVEGITNFHSKKVAEEMNPSLETALPASYSFMSSKERETKIKCTTMLYNTSNNERKINHEFQIFLRWGRNWQQCNFPIERIRMILNWHHPKIEIGKLHCCNHIFSL